MVNRREILDWFSDEVRIRMKEANMTTRQLGEKVGLKYPQMNSIISANAFPNPYRLVLLADQLDCTVNDLLGYEDLGEIWRCERFRVLSMYQTEAKYARCVADRLELYRYDHGITIENMCEKIGCDLRTYKEWIGTYSIEDPILPGTMDILKICDKLGCNPSDILGY